MPGRVKEVNERPNTMFKDNATYRCVRKGNRSELLSGIDQYSLQIEEVFNASINPSKLYH